MESSSEKRFAFGADCSHQSSPSSPCIFCFTAGADGSATFLHQVDPLELPMICLVAWWPPVSCPRKFLTGRTNPNLKLVKILSVFCCCGFQVTPTNKSQSSNQRRCGGRVNGWVSTILKSFSFDIKVVSFMCTKKSYCCFSSRFM